MKINKLLKTNLSKQEFKEILSFFKIKQKYKSFYIVGTNGKGSIAHLLNQGLRKMNYNVGVFTSPHLLEENERIVFNDKNIELEVLEKIKLKIKANFSNYNLSFFALLFISALIYFNNLKLDYVIFESGIGAKKDIVNYIKHDYGILSSIGLDHQNLLGKTKNAIANDKSYIANKNIKLFLPTNILQKYLNFFIEKMHQNNNDNYFLINNKNKDIYISNVIFTKKIISVIFKKNIDLNYILRARLEQVKYQNNNYIIDVGHNLEAIKWCIKVAKIRKINFDRILFSVLKDKDYKNIFKYLNTLNKKLYFYQLDNERALLKDKVPYNFIYVNDMNDFIKKNKEDTLVLGSFYLASKFLKTINN